MPKSSKIKKEGTRKKSSKANDPEIANLLKESLKKSRRDESELEEEVARKSGRNVDLRPLDFHQILNPDDFDSGSPVLEKVASSGPRPVFVGSSSPTTKENEEEREVRYNTTGTGKDDPKYFDSSSEYVHQENFDFVDVNGANRSSEISTVSQEAMFGKVRDARLESQSPEPRVWNPDRFDANSERKEQKYKFKVPKG